MIEIPEATRIREELDRLVGIDEYIFLDVGLARESLARDLE